LSFDPVNKNQQINGVYLNKEEVANTTNITEPNVSDVFDMIPFILVVYPIIILLGWILGERHPSHYTQEYNYKKEEKKYLRSFK